MANIKISELTELLSADVSNTILYAADLSVSPNVSHYIRVGSISTLTDYSIANAAFIKANTAFSVGFNANLALNTATSSFDKANTAHLQANVATSTGTAAFVTANSSTVLAQSSFNRANSAFVHANSSFNLANTTSINATLAYARANAAFSHASASFNLANTTSTLATNTLVLSQASFNKANSAVMKSGDAISGVITAPTAANNTSNTMLATTQFVQNNISRRIDGVPTVKAYAVVEIVNFVPTVIRGYNIASVSRLSRGRYLVILQNAMSNIDYAVSVAVSTYNMENVTALNYDHIINIETTSQNTIIVNTSDAGGGNNNSHDVYRFWITVVE
jgi:hypothetical protein